MNLDKNLNVDVKFNLVRTGDNDTPAKEAGQFSIVQSEYGFAIRESYQCNRVINRYFLFWEWQTGLEVTFPWRWIDAPMHLHSLGRNLHPGPLRYYATLEDAIERINTIQYNRDNYPKYYYL